MARGDEGRSKFPATVWLLILAWTVIVIAAAVWGLSNEEDDLTDRATAAIGGSGLEVEFTGRDASIIGTTADQATLDQAVAAVRNLRGVRRVEASALVAAPQSGPSTEPPASTTTTATASPTTAAGAGAPETPRFTARFSQPTLELSGTLPDQRHINAIAAAAVDRYGADNVTNDLTVGENTGTPSYLAALPQLFDFVGRLNPWNLTLDEGAVVFSGLGTDQATVNRIRASFDLFATGFESSESTLEINPVAVAASLTELLAEGANFETGSAELSQDAVARLDTVLEILLANPSSRLRVEGHTDDIGDAAANLALSRDRAQAVVGYLIAAGVAPDRLNAIGLGEERPIADNNSEAGRAINRRIEFSVREREG